MISELTHWTLSRERVGRSNNNKTGERQRPVCIVASSNYTSNRTLYVCAVDAIANPCTCMYIYRVHSIWFMVHDAKMRNLRVWKSTNTPKVPKLFLAQTREYVEVVNCERDNWSMRCSIEFAYICTDYCVCTGIEHPLRTHIRHRENERIVCVYFCVYMCIVRW